MSDFNKTHHLIETNNIMPLKELTNFLDSFFDISSFEPDLPFSLAIPTIYKQYWINYKNRFEADYLFSFHGLMIKNSNIIKKVFLTVFMDETVLQKILKTNIEDAIIIAHHPMWDETGGKWFLPIPENILHQLRDKRISLYGLHTPLDSHNIISTTTSLLRLLNAKPLSFVGKYHGHNVGSIWEFDNEVNFDDFVKKLPGLFDISHINFIKKNEKVKKMAIVPWWGTDIDLILSAQKNWADTYLTWDYYNKLQLPHGEEERKKFESIVLSLWINLIECSHYATEKIVMENDFLTLIKSKWIDVEFIKQDNPRF